MKINKNITRTFLLFVLLLVQTTSKAFVGSSALFKLTNPTTMQINKMFKKSEVIKPFVKSESITGLSLSGTIVRGGDDYVVRVVLIDENGKEHLVLENFEELCDSAKIHFDNYCEETSSLDGVVPASLKIYLRNATLSINSINISTTSTVKKIASKEYNGLVTDSIRYYQSKTKADRMNQYLRKRNKLWWADVTPLSLKSYDERKRILDISDDESSGGLEYYSGGIFEVGDVSDTISSSVVSSSVVSSSVTSSYVNNFDWRNRHGINWMTSVKNQGSSGYCVAFAIASALEAVTNLYYNRKIDFDLSEQEIACCNGTSNSYYGMYYDDPLKYIRNHGACDETAYPFIDSSAANYCRSDSIVPNENVKVYGYSYVGNTNEDNIKQALIKNGPLVAGFYRGSGGHAVSLVGYGVLKAGDSIRYHTNGWNTGIMRINEGDSRIGKTVWYMKNSYGLSMDAEHQGYMYMVFNTLSGMQGPYKLNVPITTTSYSNADIVVSDNDGDGYYFWGLGPKPATCPSYVPDTPDGDDSNPELGPMNQYGYCENLNPDERDTVYVTSADTISNYKNIYNHYVIMNTGKLYVCNPMIFHNRVKTIIRNGGSLIINNHAMMKNMDISVECGGRLLLEKNGKILMAKGKSFIVPKGAVLNIKYGVIE
jgi:hypothetical protein